MTQKVTINGRFAGLNEYISALNSRNRAVGNRFKKNIESEILRQLKGQLHQLKTPVWIHYTYYEINRKRDKDNISSLFRKCFQDALVRGGYLKNDGWAEIDGWVDTFKVDSERPRIEIELVENYRKD